MEDVHWPPISSSSAHSRGTPDETYRARVTEKNYKILDILSNASEIVKTAGNNYKTGSIENHSYIDTNRNNLHQNSDFIFNQTLLNVNNLSGGDKMLNNIHCSNELHCYSDLFFNSLTAITIILCIFGGAGNVLTVVAILTSRLRNNINSILICNLSIADSIYCLVLLPMQAQAFHLRDWTLGGIVCELYATLRIWLIGVNMTLLSCIAFYRFLHVVHTSAHTYSSRPCIAAIAIFICWAFPLFFSFTPLVGWWGTFSFQERILQCTFDANSNKTHKLTVVTLGYVIPCVFILVCYLRIGCVVFNSRSKTSRAGSLYRRQRAKRDSFRLTGMMALIFLGFLLGTTPFFLVNTVDKSVYHPAPHMWTPVLAWVMYTANPIIYTVMDRQFQAAYVKLLCSDCMKPDGRAVCVRQQDETRNNRSSYNERNSALLLQADKPV